MESYIKKVKKEYRPRLIDESLKSLLDAFGGVLITGPKWCGKSWSALQYAKSVVFVDNKDNRERAMLLPDSVLDGETPRLIDEWQDVPKLWDAARRLIDLRHTPGQFVFAGSAVPPEEKFSHTGTGRFARLKMRPMSLFESGDSNGSVSLGELFDSGKIEPQASDINYEKALKLICKGGWPASFWVSEQAAYAIPREYIKAVIESDIRRADGIPRDSNRVALFLRSLARNSTTFAKASTLRADVGRAEGDTISDQTIRSYLNALKRIYVLEEQDAWVPSLRSRKRIRTSPKRHFTDPSLAAAALGATPKILKDDLQTAGFMFESLCYRDVCVYADSLGGRVYYYADEKGLEVDIIVQLDDGRWGGFEVKLGSFEFDKGAANLLKLQRAIRNEDTPEPSFLAILTATGGIAHTRDDGVCIIPIDCLRP